VAGRALIHSPRRSPLIRRLMRERRCALEAGPGKRSRRSRTEPPCRLEHREGHRDRIPPPNMRGTRQRPSTRHRRSPKFRRRPDEARGEQQPPGRQNDEARSRAKPGTAKSRANLGPRRAEPTWDREEPSQPGTAKSRAKPGTAKSRAKPGTAKSQANLGPRGAARNLGRPRGPIDMRNALWCSTPLRLRARGPNCPVSGSRAGKLEPSRGRRRVRRRMCAAWQRERGTPISHFQSASRYTGRRVRVSEPSSRARPHPAATARGKLFDPHELERSVGECWWS
jgi:hypothetical protein